MPKTMDKTMDMAENELLKSVLKTGYRGDPKGCDGLPLIAFRTGIG